MTETTPVPPALPVPPIAPVYSAPLVAKTNTLAIVSLITSILWFPAVVGVITGHIAISQIKRTGESGRGLAIAGLIIGYLAIAGSVVWMLIWGALLAYGASAGYTNY